MLTISCEPFEFGTADTNNDRISFEWTNAPEGMSVLSTTSELISLNPPILCFLSGAAKQFRREWFQGDGMVRRKNLPIEYNPWTSIKIHTIFQYCDFCDYCDYCIFLIIRDQEWVVEIVQ